MAHPVITLKAANTVFFPLGIEIEQHPLGYYEVTYGGTTLQERKLINLAHKLVKHIASK